MYYPTVSRLHIASCLQPSKLPQCIDGGTVHDLYGFLFWTKGIRLIQVGYFKHLIRNNFTYKFGSRQSKPLTIKLNIMISTNFIMCFGFLKRSHF